MANIDDGEKSVFNAGVAQAERIDSLQRAINAARFNPLMVNQDTMTYNYQVIVDSLNCLFKEAWAKLSSDERDKGDRISKLIDKQMLFFPPLIKVNLGMSEDVKINNENYEKLMRLLDIYEKNIKEFLNAHDLNSPSKAEDEGEW